MYNQKLVPDQLMNSTDLLTKVAGDDEHRVSLAK